MKAVDRGEIGEQPNALDLLTTTRPSRFGLLFHLVGMFDVLCHWTVLLGGKVQGAVVVVIIWILE